jgi:hypothetical protein
MNIQKRKCYPQTFVVPANRSGNKIIDWLPGVRLAGEEFDILATFAEGKNACKCACCEYRQYVRGTFRRNGKKLDFLLPSGYLSPTNFKEDGLLRVPYGPHYGHRDEIGASDDRYLPTRSDGCEYQGSDFPNIGGSIGDTFDINLEFRGEIIDVCNNDIVLMSTTWTIKFSGRL